MAGALNEFEKMFAETAFSTIRSRAPGLFANLTGFQVLDANDEQTKAIGVFNCDLEGDQVLIPVFFLNGELKSGMMWVRSQDLMLPLDDAWAEQLRNKGIHALGQSTNQTAEQFSRSQPDFTAFLYSPQQYGKLAKAVTLPVWLPENPAPWVGEFLSSMAAEGSTPATCKSAADELFARATLSRHQKSASNLDLRTYLNGVNDEDRERIVKSASENPKSAAARHYVAQDLVGEEFKGINKSMREGRKVDPNSGVSEIMPLHDMFDSYLSDLPRYSKRASHMEPLGFHQVKVITDLDLEDHASFLKLTESEKELLAAGLPVIRDSRKEHSRWHAIRPITQMETISVPGIYQSMDTTGGVRQIVAYEKDCGCECYPVGYSHRDVQRTNLRYVDIQAKCEIEVGHRYSSDSKPAVALPGGGKRYELVNWVQDQPKLTSLKGEKSKDYDDRRWLIMGMNGQIYGTFRVDLKEEEYKTPIGSGERSPRSLATEDVDGGLRIKGDGLGGKWEDCTELYVDSTIAEPRKVGHTLFLPSSTRCMRLKGRDDGRLATLTQASDILINQVMPVLKLTAARGGEQVTVELGTGDKAYAEDLPKKQAFVRLIEDIGFSLDETIELMEKTAAEGSVSVLVEFSKMAADIPENLGDTSFFGVNAKQPNEVRHALARPTGKASLGGQPAVDSQDKQTFDAGAIAQLVGTADSIDEIDRFMGDWQLALDRLCRALFLFWKDGDEFKSRYGAEGLKELEESLRNQLKGLGDLVLSLKNKGARTADSVASHKTDIQNEAME